MKEIHFEIKFTDAATVLLYGVIIILNIFKFNNSILTGILAIRKDVRY